MTPEDDGTMPPRRFRIEDRWWLPAKEKARNEGTTISAKIRAWVIAYVKGEL